MTTAEPVAPVKQTRRSTAISDSTIYDALVRHLQEHINAPASRQGETVEARFERLLDEWRNATMLLSSTSQITSHPAYLRIIALGSAVVPFILREMKARPGHWSPALTAITGVVPYPVSLRGNIRAICQAWLEWGRTNGLVA
jgi:hypothetical protein